MALLLYQNFVSQINKPESVIRYDNQLGAFVVQSNKNSKAKGIQNISTWTDAFINYMKIFLQTFPNLEIELLTYMSIIRETNDPFEKIYRYDQQFRLRMANNPNRSWACIDGILWYTVIANGTPDSNTSTNTPTINRSCWDYNYKASCTKQICFYRHACLKCGLAHPFAYCTQASIQSFYQRSSTSSSRPVRQFVPRYNQSTRPPLNKPATRLIAPRFPSLRPPMQ